MIMVNITDLNSLNSFLSELPEGTTSNVLSSDLEVGNFDTAHFIKPDGTALDVTYIGPVAGATPAPYHNYYTPGSVGYQEYEQEFSGPFGRVQWHIEQSQAELRSLHGAWLYEGDAQRVAALQTALQQVWDEIKAIKPEKVVK